MTEEDYSGVIAETETFVQELFQQDASGHDWWHIVRVRDMALRLAEVEGADPFICQMAALLHDVADDKFNRSEAVGLKRVDDFLSELGLPEEKCQAIVAIIANMSYRGGQKAQLPLSLEGQCVQDADRLDALGAIGIARTMAYSGHKGRLIHDPALEPRAQMTLAEYRSNDGSAILHFYEKLLKLKDLMNTDAARKLAEGRHAFLETYLEQFYAEWRSER